MMLGKKTQKDRTLQRLWEAVVDVVVGRVDRHVMAASLESNGRIDNESLGSSNPKVRMHKRNAPPGSLGRHSFVWWTQSWMDALCSRKRMRLS